MAATTYLTTTYAERVRVKSLGARWDAERRQWYVPSGMDLAPFRSWLAAEVQAEYTVHRVASPAPVPSRGVGLAQLMAGIGEAVARTFVDPLWVRVEVTHVRMTRGSVSLELVESGPDGQAIAQAKGWMRAAAADQIIPAFQAATGVVLGAGIKLLVRARPNLHAQFGLSLLIDAIDPDYTLGDLEARKREIRARLRQQGLYDRNRQLPRPWDYRAVLVVSPLQAAGLGDFTAEAGRLARHGLCEFSYLHCRFQGEGAAAEVRETLLSGMQQWQRSRACAPDAVAVIRGGGPANDLAWLNDYELARTVCELPVPVLTGIGHERDDTVLDEVANIRFDTPSKVIGGIEQTIAARAREASAAFREVVGAARRACGSDLRNVHQAEAAVRQSARRQLANAKAGAERASSHVQRAAREGLRSVREKTDRDVAQVRHAAVAVVAAVKQRAPALLAEVGERSRLALRDATRGSQALMREIAGQGPEKTLQRGFAMVRAAAGSAVTTAAEAERLSQVKIQFKDGTVAATVAAPSEQA